MIDFTKYSRLELQAIVEVLDALTDDLISSDITESIAIPMREYRRAVVAEREAEELESDYAAAKEPDELRDLRTLVDTLSRCSDRLAALALAEDRRFEKSGQMNTFIKLTVLRNANRSIIDLLADIRDHYDGLH